MSQIFTYYTSSKDDLHIHTPKCIDRSFATEHFKQQWKYKNQRPLVFPTLPQKVDEGLSAKVQTLW